MPKLRSGAPHALLERWGFRWVGEVVWNKLRGGVDRWMASTVEMCILAVRGNLPLLEEPGRILGLLDAPRPRVHSAKPPEMRERIERWSPGPRLELFARSVAADWDGFGREAQRQGAELKSVV